jgi:hypothetical protein
VSARVECGVDGFWVGQILGSSLVLGMFSWCFVEFSFVHSNR